MVSVTVLGDRSEAQLMDPTGFQSLALELWWGETSLPAAHPSATEIR